MAAGKGKRPEGAPIKSGPAATEQDFWSRLASLVSGASVLIDRPKGSAHPDIPELIYPLDYGYVSGLRSGDGEGVDVWVGSLRSKTISGVICTVDLGKRDAEVKILLGCTRAEQGRILSLHNRGNQRAVLIRAEVARGAVVRRRHAKGGVRG